MSLKFSTIVSFIKLLVPISVLAILLGCRSLQSKVKQPQSTAYFFISNNSKVQTPIDIQIKIGGLSVFNDSIHYTDVRPDMQYTPSIKLKKGQYTISVTAESGKIKLSQPITLDGDRWIVIYLNTINGVGKPSKIAINIVDKEPGFQ